MKTSKMACRTYYEVLGVTRSATEGEVKAAWRELARKLHPDKAGSTEQSTDEFAELSKAYAVLRDPKSRRAYDLHLSILRQPCAVCNGEGRVSRQKGFVGRVSTKCTACNGSGLV